MWPIMYNEFYIPALGPLWLWLPLECSICRFLSQTIYHVSFQSTKIGNSKNRSSLMSEWHHNGYTMYIQSSLLAHLCLTPYTYSCTYFLARSFCECSGQVKPIFPGICFKFFFFFFFSLRSCQQLTNLFVCQLNATPASWTIASKITQLLPLLCLVVQINTFQIWFLISILLFPKRHVM